MTTLREAAEIALDALEAHADIGIKSDKAIFALRKALAQPEPEPVAIVVAAEYEDGSHAGHRLEWRGRNEANDYPEGTEFYTAPPPQRKPLTLKELKDIKEHQRLLEELGPVWAPMLYYFCQAIEKAHGIGGEE